MAKLPQNARYFFRYAQRAVEILVTYPGDIKERLIFAGEELLHIHPNALPDQLKTQYEAIISYLTEFKADPNSTWEFNTDIRGDNEKTAVEKQLCERLLNSGVFISNMKR